MKLFLLLENLQKVMDQHGGDLEVRRVFQTDFGDELVLEGPHPEYKRIYVPFPDGHICRGTGRYLVRRFRGGMDNTYCDCRAGQAQYHADNCLKLETCPSLRGIVTCPCQCHEDNE